MLKSTSVITLTTIGNGKMTNWKKFKDGDIDNDWGGSDNGELIVVQQGYKMPRTGYPKELTVKCRLSIDGDDGEVRVLIRGRKNYLKYKRTVNVIRRNIGKNQVWVVAQTPEKRLAGLCVIDNWQEEVDTCMNTGKPLFHYFARLYLVLKKKEK